MKKIFIYSGSGNENSSLNVFINKLIERFNQISKEKVIIDFYTPYNSTIRNSTGCTQCFEYGTCKIDKDDSSDNMKIIKKSMLTADYIIFASPVYGHNVSGDMKAFIDRITYWTHLLRLAGKPGTVVASCSNNGMQFVHAYLSKIFNYLGLYIVDKIGLDHETQITDSQLTGFASNIYDYINETKKVKSTDELEHIFQGLKYVYSDYPPNHTEYQYWETNGLFECDSFQDVLNSKMLEKNRLVYF